MMAGPLTPRDLESRAGRLLLRELPEEHRYRDRIAAPPGEPGDLAAYLHGFGQFLDLVRGTIEQSYADAFAEPADNGREIQGWLLPYIAELVGAELLAPDPARRRAELDNAILWFKTKGTLVNLDAVADVVSGAETVVVEGWRRVLATPRIGLPPFSLQRGAEDGDDPLAPPGLPLGTPDLRFMNRAVADPAGANPLFRLVTPRLDAEGRRMAPAETYWRPRAPRGAPCFPGAYDDTALRTPDLRDGSRPDVGPHPRRAIVHVRPPQGFFEPGQKRVPLPDEANPLGFRAGETATQLFRPADILAARGVPLQPPPERLVAEITGTLRIPDGLTIAFEDVLFTGRILVEKGGRLILRRCAADEIALEAAEGEPMLRATDCLLRTVQGPESFAELVYVTLLGEARLRRLWASDCLFAGTLTGLDAAAGASCVRFSRLPDLSVLGGTSGGWNPSNTTDDPNFLRLFLKEGEACRLRTPGYGEPGAGVLDLTSSAAITQGAEDGAEMGAYHHLYLAAQLRALRLKLRDFLPIGQDLALRYDRHLMQPPSRLE